MAPGLMQEQFAVIVREAVEVAKAVGCDEGVDAGEGQTDCLGGNAIAIFQSRNYLMRNEVEVWAELLKRPQNVVAAAHRDPVTHAIIVAGWRALALGFSSLIVSFVFRASSVPSLQLGLQNKSN